MLLAVGAALGLLSLTSRRHGDREGCGAALGGPSGDLPLLTQLRGSEFMAGPCFAGAGFALHFSLHHALGGEAASL